jgi:hypothetical protein
MVSGGEKSAAFHSFSSTCFLLIRLHLVLLDRGLLLLLLWRRLKS